MSAQSPARILLAEGDKKANSSTSANFEEAGELYQQAANSFKSEKLLREAGDAFAREAGCWEKCNKAKEAANARWNAGNAFKNAWWNAGKAYGKDDPNRHHLFQSDPLWQEAVHGKEIARDLNDLRKACELLVKAGDWYAQEDAPA
ncbi:hypothetical protein D9756_003635 [Leucocoprinus leucothites]|uniref:Alpha-soluble NSF attachment protein n=1 Tax=Leucocoprinus leucothites TaxID=201217 RepID=A0A8H5LJX8_9AGAR|nr:hypothetical protein D9756_003635 [Leucoagaricus leucothites]